YFATATPNDNYLELDTVSGTLWRSFNEASGEGLGAAQDISADGIYIDTLMQFSPIPDIVPFETDAEYKLTLRLQIDTNGDTPVTNLVVRASYVDNDGESTCTTATNYTLTTASPIVPGQWYRLTVKAVADVTRHKERSTSNTGITGFEIYLDGIQLAATTPTFGTGYVALATHAESAASWLDATKDAELIAYLQSGKVFPSLLGETEEDTIQAIGFQGESAVDDIVMSKGNPFPAVLIDSVSYDSLDDALNDAVDGDTITLLKDITLTQGLVFDSNVAPQLTLDLGGHTLSYPTSASGDYLITVDPENWLTITNGTLTTTGRGVFVHGELDLAAGASLAANCRALNIVGVDGNTNMPAVCVIAAGATVTHGNGDTVAVFVRGSASTTRQFWGAWAILDVYGTIVDAATTPGQYGITGNGGNATLAEINFYDGSVYTFADATRPMMWLPQNDLNLYGGTLTSAGGGIFVLCGTVNVPADSTLTVTANGPAGTYVSYNGGDYTGDALYLAAEGTRYPRSQYKDTLPEGVAVDQIEATIAGGTFTSANGAGIAAYVDPLRSEARALTNFVAGGVYSSEPAAALLAPKRFTKTVSDPAGYYAVYRWLLGSGTEQDPFQIADRADLELFRDQVNNANALGKAGQHFLQLADIDLGGDRWVDIGNVNDNSACFVSNPAFRGVYDGGGHVVSNFVLSGYSYCGFFGAIYGGTVKNLQVLHAVSPYPYVAGQLPSFGSGAIFCGDMEEGCLFENVTVGGTIWGNHNIGGFSAWAQDNVTMLSCTNLANVGTAFTKLGGFHPYYGGTATLFCSNCCNKGTLTFNKVQRGTSTDATAAIGGFVGYQQNAGKMVFVDCVNEGTLNAYYSSGSLGIATVGGFVGRANTSGISLAITNGVSAGTLVADVANANEQAEVGGFVGRMANGVKLSMDNVTVPSGTTFSASVAESVTPYVRAFVGHDLAATQTALLTLGVAPSDYEPGIAADIAGGYNKTSTTDGLTTYFIAPAFSVDWDTDTDASAIWGTTAPTAEELAKIESWATTNNIADPNGKLGLESYLLGCTSLLTVDPTLHIDAIEQTKTGWTITVSASTGDTTVPLSDAINGTLKVRYAADLTTGPWTDAVYEPVFSNGQATVTVTAEGAKFMKAAITR
ncbi:MAG: hypothetical protein IJ658_02965, partial [Kiritimatiellae bacterium]|nr:hypothetical protein [Kiritimatiellia bacterium]